MRLWLVDAFAERVFAGNTAGVVPLDDWLDSETMQAIATENNCAETAFFRPTGLKGNYELRWFTPATEVPLCGHATLAAGAVLLSEIEPSLDMAVFDTASGPLVVRKAEGGFTLDLPKRPRMGWDAPAELAHALGGVNFADAFVAEYANVVLPSEDAVRNLKPNLEAIARLVRGPRAGCLAVTARADEGKPYDFISRFFAPGVGLPEDPVTGSSFADLAPYWCDRLGMSEVRGFQASKRGGHVRARQTLSSVRLWASTSVYLRGELDKAVGASAARGAPAVAEPEGDLAVRVYDDLDPHDTEVRVFDIEAPAREADRDVIKVSELGRDTARLFTLGD
jgi:predicted PhzF superfamily epimerase YddE/YHI9